MIKMLDTRMVHPNPNQPRKRFDQEGIEALGVSIKEKGQLQPITVVRHPDKEEEYLIVSGERRWRACKAMNIPIKADIRSFTEEQVEEFALLENLAREDLTVTEEARGVKALLDKGRSIEEVAKIVGKSAATLQDGLYVLNLDEAVQKQVDEGHLSKTVAVAIGKLPRYLHAKALKLTQGKANGRALKAIAALDQQNRQVDFFAAQRSSVDTKELKKLRMSWEQFIAGVHKFADQLGEREDLLSYALKNRGKVLSEIELTEKMLKRIRESVERFDEKRKAQVA